MSYALELVLAERQEASSVRPSGQTVGGAGGDGGDGGGADGDVGAPSPPPEKAKPTTISTATQPSGTRLRSSSRCRQLPEDEPAAVGVGERRRPPAASAADSMSARGVARGMDYYNAPAASNFL